jgi:hypothetical protein
MAQYQLPESAARLIPTITGRFLAHNRLSLVCKAFVGADLKKGLLRTTELTTEQSSMLARVNRTYVEWAIKRYAERFEIEAGFVPLVPVAPARSNGGNGAMPPVVPDADIDDARLVHIAKLVGVDRLLTAAIAAGH